MTAGTHEPGSRECAPAPRLPGRHLPWLGPLPAFHRDPVALLRAARERVGNAFSFPLLGQDVVFVCGPEAHAEVFEADEAVLSPREAYRFMKPVFGPGIGYDAATPEEMDAQIAPIRPALGSRNLDAYARVMEAEARAQVACWPAAGEIDLLAELNRMSVAIATRCLIGEEFHRRMGPELPRLYHELESGVRLAGMLSPRLPIPAFRRRDRARAAIAEAIGEVIAERRCRRPGDEPAGLPGSASAGLPGCVSGAVREQDMLAVLLAARTEDGRPLPDPVVTGILIGMIFAGQHTSAVLAAWTGVLLMRHPQYVPRLRAEQEEVWPPGSRLGTGALHRMELLDSCVREAERLHPPLILLMRKALRDTAIRGHRVPAGSLVMISPAVAHRMPEVFRDPDRFDPSRYGAGRCEHRRPYGLIGFGGGKHRCIGLAFAYLQVKAAWSVLLREVDLWPAESGYAPDYSTFVPAPKAPCTVRYRKRSAEPS
ncbi:cytochrome P450 [Streptomyces rectiverticillatus]|uniref:cytochrome P450 n=1 Tax=Streptomyces rectiverticillatus TaxID=173860 RepID=UPI0015C3D45A|nr:cytochrome P450 [Streptomyces rectiverticillatus]QLE70257.1 cytochrome P450 [Streptomyces rectiverticillatus]